MFPYRSTPFKLFQSAPFRYLRFRIAASTRDEKSFDPVTLLRGIEYERVKGYINSNGQQSSFHEFLESNLKQLVDDDEGWKQKRKLKQCWKTSTIYPDLDEGQRHELCENVIYVMDKNEIYLKSKNRPSRPQITTVEPSLPPHPTHVVIGVDLETNGLDRVHRLEVIEVAAVSYGTGSVFHSLVNPGKDVEWSPAAEAIHRIQKLEVMNSGVKEWNEVWKELIRWIRKEAQDKKVILAAHNGKKFDFPIFLKKSGVDIEDDWSYLDTLGLAQSLKKKGQLDCRHRLNDLREHFQVQSDGHAHQADVDVIDLGNILRNLLTLEGDGVVDRINALVNGNNLFCGQMATLKKEYLSPTQEEPKKEKKEAKKKKIIRKQQYSDENVMMNSISDGVENLAFLTATTKKKLISLGFITVLQLLRHLPRTYVEEISLTGQDYMESATEICVRGTIRGSLQEHRKNLIIIEWDIHTDNHVQITGIQYCGSGSRSRAIADSFAEKFKQGTDVLIQGKITCYGLHCNMTISRMILQSDIKHRDLLPIYSSRKSIKPYEFHDIIYKVIQNLEPIENTRFLPTDFKEEYNLKAWFNALIEHHQPRSLASIEEATCIIMFHDLMCLHLLLLAKRNETMETEATGAMTVHNKEMVDVGKEAFPHELTKDQEQCLSEILEDMENDIPMLRILQGDVGTGKTIVAFLAMLAAYGSGGQAVIMVPTEILAFQHYQTFVNLIEDFPTDKQPRTELLTASIKRSERNQILKRAKNGDVDLIVGTHSLLNKELSFQKLALVVVDEQHRFGVYQRQGIKLANDVYPHMLMMSATPIPRSLALAMRGTTSISSLNSTLPWKKPVSTKLIQSKDEVKEMYKEVKKELDAGGRVYVVYPIIEKSKSTKFAYLKNAEKEFTTLQRTRFKDYECGLIHGRLSSEEKIDAFDAFASGQTQVLICTTVIEVGIDVREASVMIIHHPERFGLAQLHQLRGRIGRGDKQSTCYVVVTFPVSRINVLVESNDGTVVAHADLKNRGPGEFFGIKQSGRCSFFTYPWDMMIKNQKMVEDSQRWAENFLEAQHGMITPSFASMMKIQGFPSLDDFEI